MPVNVADPMYAANLFRSPEVITISDCFEVIVILDDDDDLGGSMAPK